MDSSAIRQWFAFREPTTQQRHQCIQIRAAVLHLVDTYLAHTQPGPEQMRGLLKLKEAQHALIGHLVNPMPANDA